jgi:general secretion pathway protein G
LRSYGSRTGYTLVELVVVIVIIGVMASIAVRSMRSANQTARGEQAKAELDRLAAAIAGNPHLISGGHRTDFGYVGDIGALPPGLDALVENPGYSTWDGPYVSTDFYASETSGVSGLKLDPWGREYVYSGGVTVTSVGGGASLSRQIAVSTDDLLLNSVTVAVTDMDGSVPGSIYRDSVEVALEVPDGSGSYVVKIRCPRPDGFVRFDSIPIGCHGLCTIFLPDSDTTSRRVVVEPGQDSHIRVMLSAELW